MRSRDHAVYVISVAAELAGMHPQTLRIYERRGLVQPARTQGGNRRYSDVDIERLRRISELAAEGMNLEGIRRVMVLESEVDRLRAENDELRAVASGALNELAGGLGGASGGQDVIHDERPLAAGEGVGAEWDAHIEPVGADRRGGLSRATRASASRARSGPCPSTAANVSSPARPAS